jgi:hypothetical protein
VSKKPHQPNLPAPRQQHHEKRQEAVLFEREVFVRGLHEITLCDAPHLGREICLRRARRGGELSGIFEIVDNLLGPGDVLDNR